MQTYNISKLSEVKTENLANFYNKVFPGRSRLLTENWRWYYRYSLFGYEPLVISVKNNLVGHAGLISTKIKINEKVESAIWFVDFVILPEFRNQGFGKILTEEWMKICTNQITFCNEQSLKIFKNLGWNSNTETERLARPINFFSWLPLIGKYKKFGINKIFHYSLKKKLNNISLTKPYSVDENYKAIFEAFKNRKIESKLSSSILRDDNWLNWRLLDCPFRKNIFYFEHNGDFAIVHIFISKNIKRLNILYTFTTNKFNEENLYKSILKWAINNEVDLIWAITNDKNKINNLDQIFKRRFTKPMNFASRSSNSQTHDLLKFGLDNIQGIDSDNDLISLSNSNN